MLSSELARLYEVEPRTLIQAVRRNQERFPDDFMFHLTLEEARAVSWSPGDSHVKHPPYAFTEQGVAMLSGVLRGGRAVSVNIAIMRAFVRLRRFEAAQREIDMRVVELETRVEGLDAEMQTIFEKFRQLEENPQPPANRIGFEGPAKD